MPGGDRRGPAGEGPRTGRAAGLCSGNEMPGYAVPGPGRMGRGFRGGRGFHGIGGFNRRRRYRRFAGDYADSDAGALYGPMRGAAPEGMQDLRNEISSLREQFKSLLGRIDEFFSKSK
jgi:hypothetical protein